MAQHKFQRKIVILNWEYLKQGKCSNWQPLGGHTKARKWFGDFKKGKIVTIRDQGFCEGKKSPSGAF